MREVTERAGCCDVCVLLEDERAESAEEDVADAEEVETEEEFSEDEDESESEGEDKRSEMSSETEAEVEDPESLLVSLPVVVDWLI